MGLREDLEDAIVDIFATNWEARDGRVVPEADDVQLGNEAVKLDATVLYADLAESTELVNNHKPEFAAEAYKAYVHCASKVIRSEGGTITSFDGDRVMGVFLGKLKNTSAARAALKINYAVQKLINPLINAQYSTNTFEMRHGVGVDSSSLFVARTGIRGSNDLVWVGRAANYAAKLCSLREGSYASWITKRVYDRILDEVKTNSGRPMWKVYYWAERAMSIYRSNWRWKIED